MKAMRPTLLLLLVLAAVAAVSGSAAVSPAVVATVTDGDTVRLADGRRVRLVQIDTPELNTGECTPCGPTALLRLVPERSAVGLETDPGLDQVDRYGRLLRYLRRGGANVNLELVRQGAAAPYFYGGDLGRCGPAVGGESREGARRGLWGACPHGARSVASGRDSAEGRDAAPRSFRGAAVTLRTRPCASRLPADLDCDVPAKRKVVGTDPHGFDGDRDGVGCETEGLAERARRRAREAMKAQGARVLVSTWATEDAAARPPA